MSKPNESHNAASAPRGGITACDDNGTKRLARRGWIVAMVIGCCSFRALAAEPAVVVAPATPGGSKARIKFGELVHDFGQIKRGTVASHTFIFTNVGTETLVITEVRPGCGCTTAGAWDKEVAPGATGRIPLQFNSTGFTGAISKSATVSCNDPTQPSLYLQLQGRVWTPVEVIPTTLMFQYDSESVTGETKVVRIFNHTPQPLEVTPPQTTNRAFKVELVTVAAGKEFEVKVTTVPPLPAGMASAPLALKTSSTEMPVINLPVYALERAAVTVAPSQILLPAGRLTAPVQYQVTVQNTGARNLVVSNAQINIPGVEVKTRTLQAGHTFSLAFGLPVGFAIEPGQNYALTINTSHPKYATIRVPLYQPRLPTPAPAAPAPVRAATPAHALPAGIKFAPVLPPPPPPPSK